MKILFLGGTYFVGKIISSVLDNNGNELTFVNRGTRQKYGVNKNTIIFDRSNPRTLLEDELDQYDVIVDTSAYNSSDIRATLPFVSEKTKKYILISSAAVYDRRENDPPFGENDVATGDAPWGDYGVLKSEAELELRSQFSESIYIIRPPYICGSGNDLERESFIWSRIFNHSPIFVPGDGRTRIQFCDIYDLASFVELIVSSDIIPSGTYNVGESAIYSFNEWIEVLALIAGIPPLIRHVNSNRSPRDYFPFRTIDLTLNVEKWHSTFQHPVRSLDESMRLALPWFQQNGRLEYHPTAYESELARGEQW